MVSHSLTQRPAWKALAAHHRSLANTHLRQLFADDPQRGERMTLEAVDLYLDYSKNRLTDETLKLLVRLADESGLRARIDAMFAGEKINVTEQRSYILANTSKPCCRCTKKQVPASKTSC